jgi:hypothetical protein
MGQVDGKVALVTGGAVPRSGPLTARTANA